MEDIDSLKFNITLMMGLTLHCIINCRSLSINWAFFLIIPTASR